MFNARSLRNKINAFKAYLCVEQPDIIVLTETWQSLEKWMEIFLVRNPKQEYERNGYDLLY